jgi:hypothetical protein
VNLREVQALRQHWWDEGVWEVHCGQNAVQRFASMFGEPGREAFEDFQ